MVENTLNEREEYAEIKCGAIGQHKLVKWVGESGRAWMSKEMYDMFGRHFCWGLRVVKSEGYDTPYERVLVERTHGDDIIFENGILGWKNITEIF